MDQKEEKAIFKQIKKQNGEEFANVLRSIHVLSIPGIVRIVKYAGRDANVLKKYLISPPNFPPNSLPHFWMTSRKFL